MQEDELMQDGTLISFVDDTEMATFYAGKAGIGDHVAEKLTALHVALVDLGALLHSMEDVNTLTSTIGETLEDVKTACTRGDKKAAMESINAAEKKIGQVRAALCK